MTSNGSATAPWAGSDFQSAPGDGTIALCGACRRSGWCRLGLTTERLGRDGVVRTNLTCSAHNEGGPHVAHGGWTASVFDEVLGHVPLLHGVMAVTAQLHVTFVKPVPVDRPLEAQAWVERREGSRWYVDGELRLSSSGAVLGRATGVFVERDPGHFERHERWLSQQSATAATAPNERRDGALPHRGA
jgi:acyl-coenzyme A thioesterase PaaI-like protein